MSKLNKNELHELFNNLRNKNQNAYNVLYEKYYSLVYGIAFSIIKNKTDAEDITHEIFTKIYKLDVDKLPSENEASWLYTVSKNESFLFIRKMKPNISIDEIFEMPSTFNEIDDIVDIEYYNKIISGLKEDEKMIISLKVLSNFTFKKISQIMNIPIGTVQWKYYKAINSLRISIGSLVGAIMAFILVCVSGDYWKNKEYLNNSNKNESVKKSEDRTEKINLNEQETQNSSEVNENSLIDKNSEINKNSQVSESNDNTIINKNEVNIQNSTKENNNIVTQDVNFYSESKQLKYSKFNNFQISALIVGIVLFITFLIFFKIYQQKLRKKSSK